MGRHSFRYRDVDAADTYFLVTVFVIYSFIMTAITERAEVSGQVVRDGICISPTFGKGVAGDCKNDARRSECPENGYLDTSKLSAHAVIQSLKLLLL